MNYNRISTTNYKVIAIITSILCVLSAITAVVALSIKDNRDSVQTYSNSTDTTQSYYKTKATQTQTSNLSQIHDSTDLYNLPISNAIWKIMKDYQIAVEDKNSINQSITIWDGDRYVGRLSYKSDLGEIVLKDNE